jgi:CubicO group peptidase (beta-lactamase class C family)
VISHKPVTNRVALSFHAMRTALPLSLAFFLTPCLFAQVKPVQKTIDDYVAPYVASGNFSGTIYVSRSGVVLFEKSYGDAVAEWSVQNTNQTRYHLASVSKPFTASAILLLEQQHQLSTSDPVSNYLPEFTEGNKITLHHLLSHTSGVVNINDFPEYDLLSTTSVSLDSIVKLFERKPLLFEPGSKFSYSNSNYNVLAYIIEKVSGMKYGDFLKKNIFDPLTMTNTAHHGNPGDIIDRAAVGYAARGRRAWQRSPYLDWAIKTGNGSLYSTVEDLGKFERSFFASTLLTETSKAKMFSPNLADVGYGWYLKAHNHRARAYMTGRSPGFSTYFARYPDEQVCVIVLSNLYIPSTKEIGENIASIVFQESHLTRSLTDEPAAGNDFIGLYQFGEDFFRPGFKFTVTESNGRLSSTWGDFLHDGHDDFVLRNYWSVIHFERDSNHKVTGLTFDGTKASLIRPGN